MTTRRILPAAGLAAAIASPAAVSGQAWRQAPAGQADAEQQALLDKATAYIQGLSSAKGRFVQTDARGTQTQGTFYLQRPGKARFAYDPPAGLLVVSNGNNVNIFDSRLKTFESYPLSKTPLNLLLAREVRLDRGVVITDIRRWPTASRSPPSGRQAPGAGPHLAGLQQRADRADGLDGHRHQGRPDPCAPGRLRRDLGPGPQAFRADRSASQGRQALVVLSRNVTFHNRQELTRLALDLKFSRGIFNTHGDERPTRSSRTVPDPIPSRRRHERLDFRPRALGARGVFLFSDRPLAGG
jgi:hypothetical protein